MGSDLKQDEIVFKCRIFQSTLPVWGATNQRQKRAKHSRFQSTLPVWGATLNLLSRLPAKLQISIHAPRVGSDASIVVACLVAVLISIHAPRVGSDLIPIKSATEPTDFNPRSPCGERHMEQGHQSAGRNISIHAPRVGSDEHTS